MKGTLKQPAFLLAALVAVTLVIGAYMHHFHNPFHFDDSHTIETNLSIRDIHNIPRFFTDATTTSSLPSNQAYRPGLTTLNAIDTWIGGKGVPDSFYFHLDIFFSFLLLGVLLFFFFLHVFEKAKPGHFLNHWLALFGTAWFWVHTANAETINYVISRSDSQSTLFIVLTFVVYCYSEKARNYLLYLIPMIAGFFIKEPVLMFAPLLLVYEYLFGKIDIKKGIVLLAVFTVAGILFLISRKLTPTAWTSGGYDQWAYLGAQPFVILHYFNNFLLPLNLSVDTDWTTISNWHDDRILVGLLFIGTLFFIAWRCSRKQETKPITFGILWFFIALAPTSSIFPFAEVMNDHRVFFPYIGLVMAFSWGIGLGIQRIITSLEKNNRSTSAFQWVIAVVALLFLSAHTYGTHKRCEVWSTSYSLWKDCALKNPNNGRGLMNYANCLVANGRDSLKTGNKEAAKASFHEADSVYTKAKGLWPYYAYIYINIGVLREWESNLGNTTAKLKEAEDNLKYAMQCNNENPECYYYLADFYIRHGRAPEAAPYLEKGLQMSPGHADLNRLKAQFNGGIVTIPALQQAEMNAKKDPTPEKYLDLSLQYYNAKRYEDCANAANEALKLRPGYVEAYNNICSAYNLLGEWDKAIEAGTKAVELRPGFELAVNNLKLAQNNKLRFTALEAELRKKPTPEGWLNFSLQYYAAGVYVKCVEASEEALKLRPDYADAYNNICAAWNAAGNWEKAIPAGEKAVALNPGSQLAKNNLAEAMRQKNAAGGK